MKHLFTPRAPIVWSKASQAVESNGFIFVSGQLPVNSILGELASTNLREAALLCLRNISAVLQEAGVGSEKIVQMTIYLKTLKKKEEVEGVLKQYFKENIPSVSLVGGVELIDQAPIMIDAIASRES